MMKISERCRKTLRTVFRGISVSVVSLIIQACYGILPPDNSRIEYGMPVPAYGMPVNEETLISGKISAKETGNPISGIQVSLEEPELSELSNEKGYFNLWVPVQEEYKLIIQDIDGQANGGLFKQQTWTLKQEDAYKTLLIGMDADTENNTE